MPPVREDEMGQRLSTRAASFGASAVLLALAATAALTMRLEVFTSQPDISAPVIDISRPEPEPAPPPPAPRALPTPESEPATQIFSTEPLNPEVDPEPAGWSQPGPAVITQPRWLETPNGADFARHYPARALARERGGRVVLDCVVAATGRLACAVGSETPAGWGFGEAALRISQSFRMSPMLENGQPTEGGRVSVPITFQLN